MRNTFQRLYAVLLLVSLSLFSVCPVFATKQMPRLADQAGLLSHSEQRQLLATLDEISERQKADIVVVTVNSLEGKTPVEYADDFYDQNGYGAGDGKDGILFLISMKEREWYISTTGYGITAVTDAGLEYMSEQFLDELKEGEYAEAFSIFAGLCDDFLTQARQNSPYDAGNLPRKPFHHIRTLLITSGAGFLISLAAAEIMRSRLKSVRSQPAADSYVEKNSMKLSRESDLFLYRHTERRKKPENQDRPGHSGGSVTHSSSSGTTHGGGGGKF